MPPAKLAASLALLGGVLWILHALLGGGDGTLLDVLHVLGLVCLMGASAVFGTTLVKSDAVAVRAVVGVASALLALSVVEAFRPDGTSWYDGFWGVVAVLLGGVALVRGRGRAPARRTSGAHAR
ncbi:hypothetical protein NYO98_01670 [Nocardioides sp. STR2]|uniref:SPW repeat-containing protein n=1 Tax=Nocardioides pini TaxID=2975053 RepID=A0ABT4C7N4_9ACTN|nr:hypothetical protein [Nocardioides pini]MCY4724969.1 hypothetical protein [Nocardioides pini]